MPGNLLDADTGFPNIDGKGQGEINQILLNYLHMLLEQLRYSFGNIGPENFNEAAYGEMVTYIRGPVEARIEDAMGNIAELSLNAQLLSARLESAEGDITQLWGEAGTLAARLSNTEGDITELTATAEGISQRVSDAEGNITTLTQSSEALAGRLTNAEGDITELTATAKSVTQRVSDAEGNITTLTQTSETLAARLTSAEGDITDVQASAEGLRARMESAEGNINTVQATADGLIERMESAEGDLTELTATASGLATQVSNAQGDITSLRESARSFEVRLSSAEGDITDIQATADGLEVSVRDLESDMGNTLSFSSRGFIVKNSTGESVSINGGQLEAGTVIADSIRGEQIQMLDDDGYMRGYILTTRMDTGSTGMQLSSMSGLRLTGNGNVWLEGSYGGFGSMNNGNFAGFWLENTVVPLRDNAYLMGAAAYRWMDVYAVNSTIQTSDANWKKDIEDLPDKYEDILRRLRPVRFRRVDGESGRYHVGFIAQEVYDVMESAGIGSDEFAGYVADEGPDGNIVYMLRYEEFIGILWKAVRRLYDKVFGEESA